ncbi:MAG: UvrD-helicase domain-containing protein [Saprospiraceae bacterium]|nr:UvrD-helicase domain-containing protein [Saprospiraceae bacterium]
MKDYLSELNAVQKAAVEQTEGPVMVIAGPGSGKTKVLTSRITHLLSKGVKPNQILSLTFTNKAAKEMTHRISNVVGNEARKIWAGTFHSIFAKILRIEASKIGYPNSFTIYDTEDSKSVINEIIKEFNLNTKEYNANAIRTRISSAKSNLITPIMYERDPEYKEVDQANRMPRTGEIYRRYVQKCQQAGAMDFDDLLLQMFRLLQENPDQVLEKYRGYFKYLLVDEFQDTNQLQYGIIKKLSLYPGSARNICIVGDDAQSIYAFRGATIQNILDFEKDFPDVKVFKLEQNYRSTNFIVKAANDVITHNKKQIKKEIWTEKNEGAKIKLLKSASDTEEGRRIANLIVEYKNRHHLPNHEIAILYRTNAQSRIFEEHLRRANIPYKVFGGMSFYQRKEVKDFIAYMRLVINRKDNEAFKRIINYPKRAIGDSTVDKFIEYAAENNISLWDASIEVPLPNRAAQALATFKLQITEMYQYSLNADAYETAQYIYKLSGLSTELKSDMTNEGISRLENVMALLDGVKEFTEQDDVEEDSSTDRSLATYLQSISLITELDQQEGTPEYITLMSTHSAKGLEFDLVFIGGLEENLFPSYMAMKSDADMDEERRLFYVAITRAKQFLVLSHASTRYFFGNLKKNEASRFLEEIDESCFETDKTARSTVFNLLDDEPTNSKIFIRPKINFAPSIPTDFKESPRDLITQGATIIHQKFGRGKIQTIEGQKDNQIATILFEEIDNPLRKIMLKFAKLQVVN